MVKLHQRLTKLLCWHLHIGFDQIIDVLAPLSLH